MAQTSSGAAARGPQLSACGLHLLAMALMLCDHLWATVVPGSEWLTCLGRLAFPIFAFLLVEGYFHTRSLKRYAGRLALCALLSEVPFDLVMGGTVFYPFHQNVLWTLLLGLGLIHLNERARASGRLWRRAAAAALSVLLALVLGLALMVDYHCAGLFTILAFYAFRGRRWPCLAGQLAALGWINLSLLAGYSYQIVLAGHTFWLPQQGFALLALIPIWLYRGRQGPHGRALRLLFYGFYPLHLLVLGLWLLLR